VRLLTAILLAASAVTLTAQTPQPFPKPATPAGAKPPVAPEPGAKPPAAPAPSAPAPTTAAAAPGAPTEAMVGAPIYPNAIYLTSYDAGRGQRFYIFGVSNAFADMVMYYRSVLKDNGEKLFDSPPTHAFETGRFREDAMAFPPSVTIKDYTFGGSPGYPNPKAGVQPAHFPTVLQFVGPPR
jgi:hypothetical protein